LGGHACRIVLHLFFFAEDAHAPLVSEGLVRKVVVKIAR